MRPRSDRASLPTEASGPSAGFTRRTAKASSAAVTVVVAALIVFLGDQLGVGAQLSTAVVVVLGIRIFGNAAAIRRHVFRA